MPSLLGFFRRERINTQLKNEFELTDLGVLKPRLDASQASSKIRNPFATQTPESRYRAPKANDLSMGMELSSLQTNKHHDLKVAVLGTSSSGKTSLIQGMSGRYFSGRQTPSPHDGITVSSVALPNQDKDKFHFWHIPTHLVTRNSARNQLAESKIALITVTYDELTNWSGVTKNYFVQLGQQLKACPTIKEVHLCVTNIDNHRLDTKADQVIRHVNELTSMLPCFKKENVTKLALKEKGSATPLFNTLVSRFDAINSYVIQAPKPASKRSKEQEYPLPVYTMGQSSRKPSQPEKPSLSLVDRFANAFRSVFGFGVRA